MADLKALQDRIEKFTREIGEEFGDLDESGALSWFDAVESRAVAIGDAVQAALVRQEVARRPANDLAKCPDCNTPGQPRGARERELIGRRGPVTLREPEHYCPACRRAFFPVDPSDRRGGELPLHPQHAPKGGVRGHGSELVRPGQPSPGDVGRVSGLS